MLPIKKFFSYLSDILLEKKSTPYNPVLKLYLSKGQLKLITKGAVYSYGNLYYNFRDSFQKLDITNRKIQDVLILGLGTGSIIQILEQKFRRNLNYDVVEIDPVVATLFEKYKNGYINTTCNIYIADAFQYLKSNHKKYDLICMDIFCDKTVPEIFESEEFLLNLKNALDDAGLMLYNRLNIDTADKIKNETFFNTFHKIFRDAVIFKLEFNWMFVVEKSKK